MSVPILNEKCIVKYIIKVQKIFQDISYGHENYHVSCVNEIDYTWPSFMNYSTVRIPQGGVNVCLDEEFLVCCDCTDDCQVNYISIESSSLPFFHIEVFSGRFSLFF